MRIPATFACIALTAVSIALPARAQTTEEFYRRNNQITFLVGSGTGGSHEVWARVIGQHMTRHLPGAPSFVVKNMPGAGGLVMANYLYNEAPKDGTYVGAFSATLIATALLGFDYVKYDSRRFGYVGSPELSNQACSVTSGAGVKNAAEALQKEIPFAGNGPGSGPSANTALVNRVTGAKFKIIEGYKSSGDTYLAMDRGEVNGYCSRLETLQRNKPDELKAGKILILFTLGPKRLESLNGVPSIYEFIKSDDDKKMFGFIRSSTELGRPIMTPPGLPAERLQALRAAFDATMADPQFLADTNKQKLEVAAKKGAELQEIVDSIYSTPKAVVEQAKDLLPTSSD